MYYRILSADENVRADEKLVKTDTVTGITLVSRDTLPASDDGLQNKIVFDSGDVSADLLFRSAHSGKHNYGKQFARLAVHTFSGGKIAETKLRKPQRNAFTEALRKPSVCGGGLVPV